MIQNSLAVDSINQFVISKDQSCLLEFNLINENHYNLSIKHFLEELYLNCRPAPRPPSSSWWTRRGWRRSLRSRRGRRRRSRRSRWRWVRTPTGRTRWSSPSLRCGPWPPPCPRPWPPPPWTSHQCCWSKRFQGTRENFSGFPKIFHWSLPSLQQRRQSGC